MPAPPRPDPPTRCCKLVYEGTYGPATWANVMWLYLTGSGEITSSELNDLAAACGEPYVDLFLEELATPLSLTRVECTLYSAGDAIQGEASISASGTVTTGTQLPASLAACISWQIAPSYRGGKPRTYLCGLPTGAIDNSRELYEPYRVGLNSAAGSFHTALESITGISDGIASVEHGVVSFVRAKAWRTPPVFYRINSAFVDSRLDSQRRRLGPDVSA